MRRRYMYKTFHVQFLQHNSFNCRHGEFVSITSLPPKSAILVYLHFIHASDAKNVRNSYSHGHNKTMQRVDGFLCIRRWVIDIQHFANVLHRMLLILATTTYIQQHSTCFAKGWIYYLRYRVMFSMPVCVYAVQQCQCLFRMYDAQLCGIRFLYTYVYNCKIIQINQKVARYGQTGLADGKSQHLKCMYTEKV